MGSYLLHRFLCVPHLHILCFNVWSPKENAVCGTFSDKETRTKIFDGNVDNIADADIATT